MGTQLADSFLQKVKNRLLFLDPSITFQTLDEISEKPSTVTGAAIPLAYARTEDAVHQEAGHMLLWLGIGRTLHAAVQVGPEQLEITYTVLNRTRTSRSNAVY